MVVVVVGGGELVILTTLAERQVECEPQLNVCQVKQSVNLQTYSHTTRRLEES